MKKKVKILNFLRSYLVPMMIMGIFMFSIILMWALYSDREIDEKFRLIYTMSYIIWLVVFLYLAWQTSRINRGRNKEMIEYAKMNFDYERRKLFMKPQMEQWGEFKKIWSDFVERIEEKEIVVDLMHRLENWNDVSCLIFNYADSDFVEFQSKLRDCINLVLVDEEKIHKVKVLFIDFNLILWRKMNENITMDSKELHTVNKQK